MSDLLSSIFGPSSILWVLAGALLASVIAYFRGRISGADAERLKQAQAEQRARDIADEVDSDIGALPPDEARKELRRW